MPKKIDMTGWIMKEHGVPDSLLTVIKEVEPHITSGGNKQTQYLCKCNCGKEVILKRGILTYDDCYIMAKAYMHSYPFVKESLRKRFRYIFIDETQDLKKYQLDLIDAIFNSNQCCLQRIGDKIQTMFKRPDRDIPEQWSVRNLKTLLNSFRQIFRERSLKAFLPSFHKECRCFLQERL